MNQHSSHSQRFSRSRWLPVPKNQERRQRHETVFFSAGLGPHGLRPAFGDGGAIFFRGITSGQLFEFLTQDNPDYTSVTALEDDILKETSLFSRV